MENCATTVSLEKNREVSPQEEIVMRFSKTVLLPNYWGKVSITPQINFKYHWEENNKKLVVEPEKFWEPETRYAISFSGGRNIMLAKIKNTEFSFNSVSYPEVADVYPHDGQRDVVLDIEDPIVVDFDKSTRDFYIKLVLEPDPEVDYMNNSDKTEFKILPKIKLEEGKLYNLKVYAKYVKEADVGYKQIFETPSK